MIRDIELLTIKEASEWASKYLKREVTPSNISYLVQYGRVKKIGVNGGTQVHKQDLIKYYKSQDGTKETEWKKRLGHDLNWSLSFDEYKEFERTKHVHRLHPYKGKFIPQLVEYFLDDHTDDFKKQVYFKKGDIVLDPFAGSGTTMVQANELGMHAIGIDVSAFNALIANVKIWKHDLPDIVNETKKISTSLKRFLSNSKVVEFEDRLIEELSKFNDEYFPSPQYRYDVVRNKVDEETYGAEKERKFLPIFEKLVKEYHIELLQDKPSSFLEKWYLKQVRNEIEYVFSLLKKIQNEDTKKVVTIILSRTMRSCRATTHADLATLLEPVKSTYYCAKHGKMCKPLFSILSWWERYSKDTVYRLSEFNSLRTKSFQYCLTGDSRSIDLVKVLEQNVPELSDKLRKQKIAGIFSSPPYVGLIDYHEQHAYAYDLFGFKRKDELEIGPLFNGQGKEAKDSYVQGIAEVLNNCKQYFAQDFNVFLVANDKYNLYPTIAEKSGMKVVNQYRRPVLNRTEKDKGAYSETIFHLKNK